MAPSIQLWRAAFLAGAASSTAAGSVEDISAAGCSSEQCQQPAAAQFEEETQRNDDVNLMQTLRGKPAVGISNSFDYVADQIPEGPFPTGKWLGSGLEPLIRGVQVPLTEPACIPGRNLESQRYCGPGGAALNLAQPAPEMQCDLTHNEYTENTATVNQQSLTESESTCLAFSAPPGEPVDTNAVPNCIGPLEKLIGVWKGSYGFSVTQLPNVDPVADATAKGVPLNVQPFAPTADKAVLLQNYSEVIVFRPIPGNVLNRGYANNDQVTPLCQQNQLIQGLIFELQVYEINSTTGDIIGLIHAESGEWLYNSVQANDNNWRVSAIKVVPHGAVPVALGNWSEGDSLEEVIAQQTDMDMSIANYPGDCLPAGWNVGPFSQLPQPSQAPLNEQLLQQTRNMTIKKFYKLDVSTRGLGRFAQLPFIRHQAKEGLQFGKTLWIESADGDTFDTIQYVQRAELGFTQRYDCRTCAYGARDPTTGCYGVDVARCEASDMRLTNNTDPVTSPPCDVVRTIKWPHFQLNTLRKVSDAPLFPQPEPR